MVWVEFTERVYEISYLDTAALAGSAPHPARAPARRSGEKQ